MIELIAAKNNYLYGAVIFCVLACITIGWLLGHQPVDKVCEFYITEADELRAKSSELNAELTKLKAKTTATQVLTDCKTVCDQQVQTALKNYKHITCED